MKKLGLVSVCLTVLNIFSCQSINCDTSKKAILVVSFGTSFIENRKVSIDATEDAIEAAFPGYDKFAAFTSGIIIKIYKTRDNIEYLNVHQAIEQIYKAGYGEVLIVPTHVINGKEFYQMTKALEPFKEKFTRMTISKPLLTSIPDYNRVVDALVQELPVVDEKTAIVLMGHGTSHHANSAYPALDYAFKHNGHKNIYVGTVEGFPDIDSLAADLKIGGYENVLLMPLMIVAGDHAHNDMVGDEEDSWKNVFESKGYKVDYILKGLGELPAIRNMFIEHAKEALLETEL